MLKADNLPPYCAVVMKSASLNFSEPSGPVQACNGTALPFYIPNYTVLVFHMTDILVPTYIPNCTGLVSRMTVIIFPV